MTNQESGKLTLEMMREDLARVLHEDPGEIHDDDNLIDLGLDSIRAMIVLTRWREAGAHIDFADMAQHPQLSYWWKLVKGMQAKP